MRRARVPLVAGLLATSVGACSIENALPLPDCAEGGSVILVVQSVPSAELVPCFEPLPAGWNADQIIVDQDGTVIRFDSDRAGDNAAIFHYAATCAIGEAVYVPSEHEGADRYEYIERVAPSFAAQRYYVFDGGCIWWEFDFDERATAALSIELGDRLVTRTRDVVNDSIRETFLDEDL